jgi:hypothetical protein
MRKSIPMVAITCTDGGLYLVITGGQNELKWYTHLIYPDIWPMDHYCFIRMVQDFLPVILSNSVLLYLML